MQNDYELLKIENQLCFPLYACAREVIKRYTPHLDKIGLTYTQYISMMLLWDKKCMTAGEMGKRLYLDSGTLTPLLKKMEEKGLLKRERSREDERNLIVSITEKGEALKEKAFVIPQKMAQCLELSETEAQELYRLLYKILD